MTTLIAPSVLSADFRKLGEEISRLGDADLIHLDLMDGHYVPNLSYGYPVIEAIHELTNKPLDAHLMVTNPADYVEGLPLLGVKWISFHPETVYHPHRLVQSIKAQGVKAGYALNPAAPLNILDDILPELDYVLLMSVNPGYSAQSFITSVIKKVASLSAIRKNRQLKFLIEVDGGVNDQNAAQLIDAGADILVSASFIFNSSDYSLAINKLKGL